MFRPPQKIRQVGLIVFVIMMLLILPNLGHLMG
ncbi:hypothetical protein AvCA_23890 [Azotobacter vinelandii CA]|uniref:Uncharacterized protein n=2 Tax=Azotobacter vinelandii TaxID=354 RepID=C1DHI1_AZOVD|nr:hypothetical protein Avin_23890 [Azotobacter vinelandii DJ]AGK16689.1 hypothetical protein AvCA_23890 [Azotobacter vinelandii CA]AGK20598.1 hypothetical protein AvCA6_23890 [Azotobacter vinelandii CA6]